jgi:transcriptional regulator with XRE-family HTH domain
VKLRKVMALRAEGWTQKQIAKEFGKDIRTIRRWEQEARRQKLVVLENLTPEEVLADFLFGNAELSWNLRRQLKAAQDAGDILLVLKCVRELTHLSNARIAILDRIGLFDRFAFPGLRSGAPGQEGVTRLHQAVRNAETGTYEVDQENSGAEERDGQESLY